MNSRFCVFAIAVVLYSAVAFGEPVFKAHFNETHVKRPNSTMQGILYYRYNVENPNQSLLALEYVVPSFQNGTAQSEPFVRNVYVFEESAMYSMCTHNCSGINFTEFPDPWYNADNYYEKEGNELGDGYFWFTRTSYKPDITSSLNEQVSRILMKESSDPSAVLHVKEIEFRSGRKLVLSEQHYYPEEEASNFDGKFVINAGCPSATCPIYADLIFVLDNSWTVTKEDWTQAMYFVKNVTTQFTFSEDAAKGTIIMFRSPDWDMTWEYVHGVGWTQISCPGKQFFDECPDRCAVNYNFYLKECDSRGHCTNKYDTELIQTGKDNTAKVLPPLTGLTANADEILYAADYAIEHRPDNRGTCQAYGLLLAMETINASRRSGYDKRPQPIVIVVSDGDDHCRVTTTKRAAEIQAEPYNAHLIEIGVGIDGVCDEFDRKFLENISSHFAGQPSYYPATDYNDIHNLVDRLFVNLCEGFADNDCGSGCEGFCGCGKCFCPTCDGTGSLCSSFECDSDEENSDGCVYTEKKCSGSDVCTVYSCNETGDCAPSVNTSSPIYAELTQKYQGDCYSFECDISSQETSDGWSVYFNDKYCQNLFGNGQCITYNCSRDPETDADKLVPGPNGERTGCYLVENKIEARKKQLEDNGMLYDPNTGEGCLQVSCDPETGAVTDEVYCTNGLSKDCAVCGHSDDDDSGSYQCVPDVATKPRGTNCTSYSCTANGWEPATKTEEFCREKLGNPTCARVQCEDDVKGGCTKVEKSCNCSDTNETYCLGRSATDPEYGWETDKCCIGRCNVTEEEEIDCVFECEDCSTKQTLVAKIDQMNTEDNKHCFRPACSMGQCTFEPIPYPPEHAELEDNYCTKWICVKNEENGEWGWSYEATELNKTCKSDGCTDRVCDPGYGCRTADKCVKFTNDCFVLTCEDENGGKVCKNTSQLVTTKCMTEVCRDGRKYPEQHTERCSPNKCQNAVCVFTDEYKNVSECRYSQKDAPDNDLCKIWECDINTGEWHDSPTCDDGLYCTTDKCWKGQCRYPDVACDLELNMDGYPCFQPKCKEAEGRYKCVRKLIPNAYIDICGHCIMSDDETSSGSGSSVDMLTSCTGAPPKPVLTQELAAAAIALIILAAVIVGAGITASGVIGTKQLIDRAKGANNQSAHSNPLFEDNETELSNPAYIDPAI